MPVYDPLYDTWERLVSDVVIPPLYFLIHQRAESSFVTSLRSRAPFSITVILFVGKRIQDAGKPTSEKQRMLREYAENIG